MKRTNVRKTLENKNTCLYNKTMNIEIKNSNTGEITDSR